MSEVPDKYKTRRTLNFLSTKTYTHEVGLSCCFRQWKADSHCHFLHGYALKISFEFKAFEFDKNGWVMNFGGLKPIKAWLEEMFDHKTVVALDDPEYGTFCELQAKGLIQLCVVEHTGCEAFAAMIYQHVAAWLKDTEGARVILTRVEVSEHGGNSAIVTPNLELV